MTPVPGNHLRIIPRYDVKYPNLVNGVRLEGFRVAGDPVEYAQKYELEGADEIIYQDIAASVYQRNDILSLVEMSGTLWPVQVKRTPQCGPSSRFAPATIKICQNPKTPKIRKRGDHYAYKY